MKKLFLSLCVLMALWLTGYAADTTNIPITSLTAVTNLNTNDIFLVIASPGTTNAAAKKITASSLRSDFWLNHPSSTNGVNLTATNSWTYNGYAGKINCGVNTTYYLTNALATANSIVLATVNDANGLSTGVMAKSTAGLLTFTVLNPGPMSVEVSWAILVP